MCISAHIYCIHICSVCAHTTCISSESEAAHFSQSCIVKRYLRLLRSLLLLRIVDHHGQACCHQHTQSTHTQIFSVGLFYVCRGLSCVCIGNFCVCTGLVCGCRIQHAYAVANVYVCIPVYAC